MHEDVQVTKEGIQYKVLQPGSGAQPTAASTVKVHYTGTLLDGTEFDSSVDKGEPIEFNLGGNLIQGWKLAIPLMKEGAKYRFWIPQELAYGANPRPGGPIKPYQMLIFDIELIEIVK